MSKIFGVGFFKTGTTSMEAALGELGYKVCRGSWKNPATNLLTAFALNRDYGRIDRIIAEYDAFFDMPFCGGDLVEHLRTAYPDAKFILTVRDANAWFDSLTGMFARLSSDPGEDHLARFFSEGRMAAVFFFESLFEVREFGGAKDRIVDVYERYNAEVERTFAGSPRFLKMDVSDPNPWESLCGFLGKDVPAAPFPHLNRGSK